MTTQFPTMEAFTEMSRDNRLVAWQEAKRVLDAAKEAEMSMRQAIITAEFDVVTPGTQNAELGRGYKLKAVIKERYTLDRDTAKVDAVLDTLEDWQAERLVKWKPEMSVSEYKKLSDEDRKAVDTVLTISPASPTLEIVAPKNVR